MTTFEKSVAMPETVDSLFQPLPAFKQGTRSSFRASFSSASSIGWLDVDALESILNDAEDVLDTCMPELPSSSSHMPMMEPRPIEQVFTPSNTMQWNPPDADTAKEFIKMFSFGNFNKNDGDIIKPTTTLSSLTTTLPRKESSSSLDSGNNNTSSFKTEQWSKRFQELLRFKGEFGHCLVPHNWPQNKKLAQWVKRQRYQHRLLEQGRHSTLTADRVQQLEDIGFVWNSHKAGWDDKFQQLKEFQVMYKHCNVPSSWSENPSLAVWVKFQRRQYKLKVNGGNNTSSDKSNTLTDDRIEKLLSIGFSFDPRNTMV